MGCSICFEDVKGAEMNPEELWCHGHVVHASCLFQWCQWQKLSISSTKCIACAEFLPLEQQSKLINHLERFQERMFDFARRDQVGVLKTFLNQRGFWSEECFVKLVKVALSSKSSRVLRYLRNVEGLYLGFKRREAFVLELFTQRTEMDIRWLVNDFDDQTCAVPTVCSDLDILEMMRIGGQVKELLWIYQAHYKSFPERIQFYYILNIFRAFKANRFEFSEIPMPFPRYRGMHYNFLLKLAYNDMENCCYIMGKILPYAAMKEFDPTNGNLMNVMDAVNSCHRCKRSHIPEVVLLAIKEGELDFLRYILRKFKKNSKPILPESELVRLIAKSDHRDEIMDIIETLDRWKDVKKLRKLYNENMRKSEIKVRFWKCFVA